MDASRGQLVLWESTEVSLSSASSPPTKKNLALLVKNHIQHTVANLDPCTALSLCSFYFVLKIWLALQECKMRLHTECSWCHKFHLQFSPLEPSYTAGGNVNWCRHYGKQCGGSLKN